LIDERFDSGYQRGGEGELPICSRRLLPVSLMTLSGTFARYC
jgi:hypothetical protein